MSRTGSSVCSSTSFTALQDMGRGSTKQIETSPQGDGKLGGGTCSSAAAKTPVLYRRKGIERFKMLTKTLSTSSTFYARNGGVF